MIEELRTDRSKDIGKACRILKISRSTLHYQSVKNDQAITEHLERLSEQQPVEGFWKYYHRIRNSGIVVNHKRQMGMILTIKSGYIEVLIIMMNTLVKNDKIIHYETYIAFSYIDDIWLH